VLLREVVSGKVVKTIPEKDGDIQSVAFSPDGSRFAYGDKHGKLHVCKTETAKELWWKQAHSAMVRGLVFSRDGTRLYSGGGNEFAVKDLEKEGSIKVWDSATGQVVRTLAGHLIAVRCLSLSPDGTRLLSCGGTGKSLDCTVRLWDLDSHKQLKCFPGHKTLVTGVAFAPDGQHAVSVSFNQTILWDLDASPEKAGHDLKGASHRAGYGARVVAFVGEQIVTPGNNSNSRQLRVWDLDGAVIGERILPHVVNGLAPSADGKHLAMANSNGTVSILRFPLRPLR
jgi:WD40 repeat protein